MNKTTIYDLAAFIADIANMLAASIKEMEKRGISMELPPETVENIQSWYGKDRLKEQR